VVEADLESRLVQPSQKLVDVLEPKTLFGLRTVATFHGYGGR
jgi:hypothetical protein